MRSVIIASAFTLFCLPAFAQKVAYELPDEMAEHVKKEYTIQCDKGKILWDLNCASCHNQKVKGKQIIPDFSLDQLKGYELRVSNARHEEGIPETTVTAEELGLIMTFLTYKKKNK